VCQMVLDLIWAWFVETLDGSLLLYLAYVWHSGIHTVPLYRMVFEDNYISYDVSYVPIVISFIFFNASIFLISTLQDDSYLESYISTIGVDFVSWFLSWIK